ncbi:hypothetical protein NVP1101O_175 [Vibrio phage 1.101.O._10N.261.45.C6]|nr:hypothetical protein NVP1101O_175 [Vibrio phage 1.101.O._10N.261.45.C6]
MLGLQNIIKDVNGVDRFEENLLVSALIDQFEFNGSKGLNALSIYFQVKGIPVEHYSQITQLIGYSVSGWGGLSTTSDEDWETVQEVILCKEG